MKRIKKELPCGDRLKAASNFGEVWYIDRIRDTCSEEEFVTGIIASSIPKIIEFLQEIYDNSPKETGDS